MRPIGLAAAGANSRVKIRTRTAVLRYAHPLCMSRTGRHATCDAVPRNPLKRARMRGRFVGSNSHLPASHGRISCVHAPAPCSGPCGKETAQGTNSATSVPQLPLLPSREPICKQLQVTMIACLCSDSREKTKKKHKYEELHMYATVPVAKG